MGMRGGGRRLGGRVAGWLTANVFRQFEESQFAVPANDVIDEAGTQAHVGVLGGEVSAPDNGEIWVATFEFAAEGRGLLQLRSGHHGDAENRRWVARDQG